MELSKFVEKHRLKVGESYRGLGRRIGHASNGMVSDVEKGSPVPLEKVEKWAEALELKNSEMQVFYMLCLEAQSQALAAWVKGFRSKVAKSEQERVGLLKEQARLSEEQARLSSIITELKQMLIKLGVDIPKNMS